MKIQKNIVFRITIAIIVILFLHYLHITASLENLIIRSFNPLLAKVYSLGNNFENFLESQTDKRNLANEVQRLEIENQILLADVGRLKALEKENQTLRGYLDFGKKKQASFLLANIISRSSPDFLKPSNSIILDKGKVSGLTEGLAVINSQGILIGKIIRVEENLSEACLSVSPDCQFAAGVENNAQNTLGIVGGDLGLTIKMNFIPQNIKLELGDLITTSGLEEKIPAGLIVGKIIRIHKENNDVWQSAIIEPLFNLNDLRVIGILLN